MALPSSGTLSLSDIASEFGGSTPHSLSEYYGAASGIPSSGTISVSDFYGASNIPTVYTFIDSSSGYRDPSMFLPKATIKYKYTEDYDNTRTGRVVFHGDGSVEVQLSTYYSLNSTEVYAIIDLRDWPYGDASDFANKYSRMKIKYRINSDSYFFSGRYTSVNAAGADRTDNTRFIITLEEGIRGKTNYYNTVTYDPQFDREHYHKIGVEGYANTNSRKDIDMRIFELEALP